MKPIAVLFIHGVEIEDPDFAEVPTRLLQKHFERYVAGTEIDAKQALVVEPVHWAPVLEALQADLFRRTFPGRVAPFFDELRKLVQQLNAGAVGSLLPFMRSLARRRRPYLGDLNYATARWVMTHFVGDVIAYEITPSTRANYDAIHRIYASALKNLAERAGPDAPLCVIAHSHGCVISSNFFYDLQAGEPTLAPQIAEALGPSPLERGETLLSFYTLGSPMALWTLRYPDRELDRPIQVPAPKLAQHHPSLTGEWVNFYDDDDVIAYPLKCISPAYDKAVSVDRKVSVRGPLLSWMPLVHPFYWTDDRVMRAIAISLADASRRLNA